jgi:hypothetical protein
MHPRFLIPIEIAAIIIRSEDDSPIVWQSEITHREIAVAGGLLINRELRLMAFREPSQQSFRRACAQWTGSHQAQIKFNAKPFVVKRTNAVSFQLKCKQLFELIKPWNLTIGDSWHVGMLGTFHCVDVRQRMQRDHPEKSNANDNNRNIVVPQHRGKKFCALTMATQSNYILAFNECFVNH